MNKNKVIFFVATRWFGALKNTQLLREKLLDNRYQIYIFGQKDELFSQFETKHVNLHTLHIKSSYFSFYFDILDIIKLVFFIFKLRPAAIHAFNPKPIFISFFSICLFFNTKFFTSQTGMGNLFSKNKVLLPIILLLFKMINKKSSSVFFYNKFDSEIFLKKKIIDKNKVIFIGPYVNINNFILIGDKPKKEIIRVICISRLLKQKGVIEFIEVARKYQLDKNNNKAEFLLIGEIEVKHDDKIDKNFILSAEKENIIKRIDRTNNIKYHLHNSDILFLHSYREGAPSVIIEASAAKLPTIGSDAIGVRDLIINGKTGYITEMKNIHDTYLVTKMLINNDKLIKKLGQNAFDLIAKNVDIKVSTLKQIKEYNKSNINLII